MKWTMYTQHCVLTTVNLCASLRHICRHCARTASGLPSWILNLYWTRWALAVVFVSVSSFLHFFLFLATCARLSWQHSALSVHVKLFCRIVSYHSSQLGHRVWLKAWYYCCLLWTSSVGCWRGEAGDCLSVMLCTVGCSASGCLQDDTDDGGRQHGTSCFSSHLSLSLSVCVMCLHVSWCESVVMPVLSVNLVAMYYIMVTWDDLAVVLNGDCDLLFVGYLDCGRQLSVPGEWVSEQILSNTIRPYSAILA